MKIMLIATVSFSLLGETVFAWGDPVVNDNSSRGENNCRSTDPGHKAIWTVAQAQLTTKARQHVTTILGWERCS